MKKSPTHLPVTGRTPVTMASVAAAAARTSSTPAAAPAKKRGRPRTAKPYQIGPRAFRHVIATDHPRRNPGAYLTVAILLHDKLATVLKNYSHLDVEDGLRRLSSGIQLAQEELAAARCLPATHVISGAVRT